MLGGWGTDDPERSYGEGDEGGSGLVTHKIPVVNSR